jgi:hypothetical protein
MDGHANSSFSRPSGRPSYRRLGLAKTLMDYFEDVSIHTYNANFVDLFVRSSNTLAIKMYEKFGYSTYRRVLGYYSGVAPEDALDMRKALPRYVNNWGGGGGGGPPRLVARTEDDCRA